MNPSEFSYLADLLHRRSGLAIKEDKLYLLESRLLPIARSYNCLDLSAFVTFVRGNTFNEQLLQAITEAMTTNESMFFRDQKPFEKLNETTLPDMMDSIKQQGKLRIWSAACSNGQEPYSIAMTLLEQDALFKNIKIEIVATDIDGQVLDKAREGMYTQFEVQRGLPIKMLLKYFEQQPCNRWQIKPELKELVTFKQHNLLDGTHMLGAFDIIFCRNVLIYFNESTKKQVLVKLASALNPKGTLFLGSAETVLGLSDSFHSNGGESGMFVKN